MYLLAFQAIGVNGGLDKHLHNTFDRSLLNTTAITELFSPFPIFGGSAAAQCSGLVNVDHKGSKNDADDDTVRNSDNNNFDPPAENSRRSLSLSN